MSSLPPRRKNVAYAINVVVHLKLRAVWPFIRQKTVLLTPVVAVAEKRITDTSSTNAFQPDAPVVAAGTER